MSRGELRRTFADRGFRLTGPADVYTFSETFLDSLTEVPLDRLIAEALRSFFGPPPMPFPRSVFTYSTESEGDVFLVFLFDKAWQAGRFYAESRAQPAASRSGSQERWRLLRKGNVIVVYLDDVGRRRLLRIREALMSLPS